MSENRAEAAVPSAEQFRKAAEQMDWMQVVLNQGPPCFHFEPDRGMFCGRAQRWFGHDGDPHDFLPLHNLLEAHAAECVRSAVAQERERTEDFLRKLAWSEEDIEGWKR